MLQGETSIYRSIGIRAQPRKLKKKSSFTIYYKNSSGRIALGRVCPRFPITRRYIMVIIIDNNHLADNPRMFTVPDIVHCNL